MVAQRKENSKRYVKEMHDEAEPHTTQDILRPQAQPFRVHSRGQKGVERLVVSNLPLRRKKMKSRGIKTAQERKWS